MNIESEIRNLNRDLMEEYDSLDKKKPRMMSLALMNMAD
jgi:hypothetical protein